ncbi:MAG TPA: type I-E CRISPR-associated protein Cas6/Cse3/CasE [Thermoclostridium sp.]|nr:type I-E CRISPR-associated protein Cas6/Cse3/CasE [Thermoclostridium sp.]
MYLSRVKIDFNNRRKTRDLDHLGAYHNWVEESFPNEVKSGERSRKMWRIDQVDSDPYLLVLSKEKPDIENLEKYGVANSAQTKDYNVLLNQLRVNDKLRFRVVLNPVTSLSQGKASGKRGRIIPLVTVDQQLDFLKQRAGKHGFSLDDEVMITERSFEILKRPNQKPLKISKAAYGGFLTIEDLELFKAVLVNGLGKKKAYGFGLLTVIPGDLQ